MDFESYRRAQGEAFMRQQNEKALRCIATGAAYLAKIYGPEVAAEELYRLADEYAIQASPRLFSDAPGA